MQAAVRRERYQSPRSREQALRAQSILTQHHVRWGAIGYAVGLAMIVPAVLWATNLEPRDQGSAPPAATSATEGPVLVSGPSPVTTISRDSLTRLVGPEPAPVADDAMRERLDAAAVLIQARSIEPARARLRPLAEAGDGEALYLLASTYDPIQLAALGVSDVRAEAERARHLYMQALMAGVEAARGRLEQLR